MSRHCFVRTIHQEINKVGEASETENLEGIYVENYSAGKMVYNNIKNPQIFNDYTSTKTSSIITKRNPSSPFIRTVYQDCKRTGSLLNKTSNCFSLPYKGANTYSEPSQNDQNNLQHLINFGTNNHISVVVKSKKTFEIFQKGSSDETRDCSNETHFCSPRLTKRVLKAHTNTLDHRHPRLQTGKTIDQYFECIETKEPSDISSSTISESSSCPKSLFVSKQSGSQTSLAHANTYQGANERDDEAIGFDKIAPSSINGTPSEKNSPPFEGINGPQNSAFDISEEKLFGSQISDYLKPKQDKLTKSGIYVDRNIQNKSSHDVQCRKYNAVDDFSNSSFGSASAILARVKRLKLKYNFKTPIQADKEHLRNDNGSSLQPPLETKEERLLESRSENIVNNSCYEPGQKYTPQYNSKTTTAQLGNNNVQIRRRLCSSCEDLRQEASVVKYPCYSSEEDIRHCKGREAEVGLFNQLQEKPKKVLRSDVLLFVDNYKNIEKTAKIVDKSPDAKLIPDNESTFDQQPKSSNTRVCPPYDTIQYPHEAQSNEIESPCGGVAVVVPNTAVGNKYLRDITDTSDNEFKETVRKENVSPCFDEAEDEIDIDLTHSRPVSALKEKYEHFQTSKYQTRQREFTKPGLTEISSNSSPAYDDKGLEINEMYIDDMKMFKFGALKSLFENKKELICENREKTLAVADTNEILLSSKEMNGNNGTAVSNNSDQSSNGLSMNLESGNSSNAENLRSPKLHFKIKNIKISCGRRADQSQCVVKNESSSKIQSTHQSVENASSNYGFYCDNEYKHSIHQKYEKKNSEKNFKNTYTELENEGVTGRVIKLEENKKSESPENVDMFSIMSHCKLKQKPLVQSEIQTHNSINVVDNSSKICCERSNIELNQNISKSEISLNNTTSTERDLNLQESLFNINTAVFKRSEIEHLPPLDKNNTNNGLKTVDYSLGLFDEVSSSQIDGSSSSNGSPNQCAEKTTQRACVYENLPTVKLPALLIESQKDIDNKANCKHGENVLHGPYVSYSKKANNMKEHAAMLGLYTVGCTYNGLANTSSTNIPKDPNQFAAETCLIEQILKRESRHLKSDTENLQFSSSLHCAQEEPNLPKNSVAQKNSAVITSSPFQNDIEYKQDFKNVAKIFPFHQTIGQIITQPIRKFADCLFDELHDDKISKIEPDAQEFRDVPSEAIESEGKEHDVTQLASQSLIPEDTLKKYLAMAIDKHCLIFYGPSGTGKSFLARCIGDSVYSWLKKESKPVTCQPIYYSNVTSVQWNEIEEDMKHIKERKINAVLIMDGFEINFYRRGLQNLDSLLQQTMANNIYVIAAVRGHAGMDCCSSTLSGRKVWLTNDEEPISGLLSRYLRKKFEIANGSDSLIKLYQLANWLTQAWQILYSFMERCNSSQKTIGPSVFFSCPTNFEEAEEWFIDLWNYSLAPCFEHYIRDGSSHDEVLDWIIQNYPWEHKNTQFSPNLRNLQGKNNGYKETFNVNEEQLVAEHVKLIKYYLQPQSCLRRNQSSIPQPKVITGVHKGPYLESTL